jgi:hypothetical protein
MSLSSLVNFFANHADLQVFCRPRVGRFDYTFSMTSGAKAHTPASGAEVMRDAEDH